ncbi:MAG: CPBP family intramembrane metalloprotease [Deltaproteobacteria bacterium]|nr:CPBP family intramembrane metalloprotease [Deltaproteobacteria bacterium]
MWIETTLILIGFLTAARLIAQFRDSPFIGGQPHLFIALLLIYVPYLHQRIRRLDLPFFEGSFSELIRSLRCFCLTSLLLFPLFLIANHFYQSLFLETQFREGVIPDIQRLLMTHLFLVALPEEFFFRGWLQPLLSQKLKPLAAIVVTSLLFAFSHSVIQLAWWHFAIFFPGLVFGWLREKTGAITASVLFHTISNLLVAWIGSVYR